MLILCILTVVVAALWGNAFLSSAEDAIPNGFVAMMGTAFVFGGWIAWLFL